MLTPLLCVGLLALASPVPVGELDKSLVPAGTPFLIHVDVQGLLRTELAKSMLELGGDELWEGTELAEIERELGINPLEDILSVTLFSATGDADGGVALVRISGGVDALIQRARQEDEYRSYREGGVLLHSMDDEVIAYVHPSTNGDQYVLLSDDKDQVLRAARVLRGDAQSLAQDRAPGILGKPRKGAFVYAEVGNFLKELTKGSPASQVGSLAKRINFQAGEREGRMFVRAELETEDLDDAQNVANVARGLLSLASLIGGSEVPPFATELLGSIDVEVAGTLVRFGLDFDSRELVRQIRALSENDWDGGDDYDDYDDDDWEDDWRP